MGQLDDTGRTAKLGRAAYYEVQSGDTLEGIAARFDTDPETLARVNGLALRADALRAGLQLQVNGL